MTYQREFERKLNVAIVGVGSHSYRNILPAMHYLPVTIAAVCDINEDLAKLTAAQYGCRYYTDARDMYEQESLDAVFLCVSARLHPQLAIDAFQAGLHVWLEKPVALRVSEVEEMIRHRKDRVAVAGFKKAFMPAADKALEVVNSPQYGKLLSILATYPMSLPENGKEALESGSPNPWLANSSHPLAIMLAVGGKVSSVVMHRDRNGRGVCLLEYANGTTGNLHFASGPQPLEHYFFYGEDWNLTIDNGLRVSLNRGIPFQYDRTFHYIPAGADTGSVVWEPQNCWATLENKALFTQGMYAEMKYFCDCILNGETAVRGSLEFAVEMMKVHEAVLLSNGARIAIN